jgi:hypothetical protein
MIKKILFFCGGCLVVVSNLIHAMEDAAERAKTSHAGQDWVLIDGGQGAQAGASSGSLLNDLLRQELSAAKINLCRALQEYNKPSVGTDQAKNTETLDVESQDSDDENGELFEDIVRTHKKLDVVLDDVVSNPTGSHAAGKISSRVQLPVETLRDLLWQARGLIAYLGNQKHSDASVAPAVSCNVGVCGRAAEDAPAMQTVEKKTSGRYIFLSGAALGCGVTDGLIVLAKLLSRNR